MGKSTISMAIFNSYVKLPEGTSTAYWVGFGSTPVPESVSNHPTLGWYNQFWGFTRGYQCEILKTTWLAIGANEMNPWPEAPDTQQWRLNQKHRVAIGQALGSNGWDNKFDKRKKKKDLHKSSKIILEGLQPEKNQRNLIRKSLRSGPASLRLTFSSRTCSVGHYMWSPKWKNSKKVVLSFNKWITDLYHSPPDVHHF